MEFFEKVKDIEEIYKNLINKAKNANLEEIQDFKEKQEVFLTNLIKERKFQVDSTLDSLTQSLNKKSNKFQFELTNQIKELDTEYQENLRKLQKLIIKQLGFEF
jgi:hypothetical protein